MVTMADQWKVIDGLSNRATFNDLERPQTQIKVTPFFDAEYLRTG